MKIFIKVKAARRQLLNVIADDGTIFAITILIFMTISNINNSEQDGERQKNLLRNGIIIVDVINTTDLLFRALLTDDE